ncbi:MAG: hypothetical protein Q8P20_06335 [bacterium]|nr:hypothetical protein [bacterium]
MGLFNKPPKIGGKITWDKVINQVLKVLEFDRNKTTINENGEVKAKSAFTPYGYLLVESPILNKIYRLPIIHRDDFMLATYFFDNPSIKEIQQVADLLVAYSPKHVNELGLSVSPHHVLHYAVKPKGTFEKYYSNKNNAPEKILGPFKYDGMIDIHVDSEDLDGLIESFWDKVR